MNFQPSDQTERRPIVNVNVKIKMEMATCQMWMALTYNAYTQNVYVFMSAEWQ